MGTSVPKPPKYLQPSLSVKTFGVIFHLLLFFMGSLHCKSSFSYKMCIIMYVFVYAYTPFYTRHRNIIPVTDFIFLPRTGSVCFLFVTSASYSSLLAREIQFPALQEIWRPGLGRGKWPLNRRGGGDRIGTRCFGYPLVVFYSCDSQTGCRSTLGCRESMSGVPRQQSKVIKLHSNRFVNRFYDK